MSDQVRSLSIGDLVRSKIVDAGGKSLGRVVDVEIDRTHDYRVVGVIFGGSAWLYRWGALKDVTQVLGVRLNPKRVRWEDVDRFERLTLHLKRGARPEDVDDPELLVSNR